MTIFDQFALHSESTPTRIPVTASSELALRSGRIKYAPKARPLSGQGRSAHRGREILKRGLDLVVAFPFLVVLAPLLAIVWILIRLDSPGPALFRQQRLGLNGRPFRIFKFRTMRVLEDGESVRQAQRNDERVTAIGRFLRCSSLDELPQLINVVRGEMSLVGPRPHAIAHDRLFASLIGGYSLRQSVKPGMTGWAQINGFRGATPTVESMRRRVEHDLWYARNFGFALDLRILVRTPIELLRRRNAY